MLEYVYARHDFVPEHDDEISFRAGERIEVVEKDEQYGDGWWKVCSRSPNQLAPSTRQRILVSFSRLLACQPHPLLLRFIPNIIYIEASWSRSNLHELPNPPLIIALNSPTLHLTALCPFFAPCGNG